MTATADGSLGRLLRRGAAWSTLDVALGRFSSFALGLVVARLLRPHDFGVFAVALVVHALVVNISELGVSAALIRDDDQTMERGAPTVATIALATSVGLGALMALGAPTLARLLGSPHAAGAIAVMSLTLPLAGITAVPSALLRREFRMDRLFVADTSNLVVTAVVVISLALAGWGPMALAWSWVAGQVATTAILVWYMPGRCRLGFDRTESRRLVAFGLPLAGASLIAFSIQNVDYIVVGRLLGAVPLGLYVLAFNISGWPMNVFSSVIRTMSLPAFARLQDDPASLPRHFANAVKGVASVTFPACLLLGALARPLVISLYGPRWAPAANALVGLSVLGALRTVIELFGDFLVAKGRTRPVFLVQLPWLASLTVFLVLGVHARGIAGAGFAQAIAAASIVPAYGYFLWRAGVAPSLLVRSLMPPMAWAGASALGAWLVASQIPNPWLACLAGGSTGVLIACLPHLRLIRRTVTGAIERRRNRQNEPDVALVGAGFSIAGDGIPEASPATACQA